MATVFDSVGICGLRITHFKQLLSYIDDAKRYGWHYGNKKQYEERHGELRDWVLSIIYNAESDSVIIPKKKGE